MQLITNVCVAEISTAIAVWEFRDWKLHWDVWVDVYTHPSQKLLEILKILVRKWQYENMPLQYVAEMPDSTAIAVWDIGDWGLLEMYE